HWGKQIGPAYSKPLNLVSTLCGVVKQKRGGNPSKATTPQTGGPVTNQRGAPALLNKVRQCPTLPQPPGCSTIGAVSLSFRVRNGTGRFPHAITTVTLAPKPTTTQQSAGKPTITGHHQVAHTHYALLPVPQPHQPHQDRPAGVVPITV